MSSSLHTPATNDQTARAAATDPSQSVLVQAPAGSGKTDLLTLRYLALLPTVAEPEQVLAITFTRKATAEMRARVLAAFAAARHGSSGTENEHQRRMREYAVAALAHAQARGWDLEGQPQRLNIQTIDSLALSIAHEMPLLSRLGGQLSPIDDASAQHLLAAQRTMALLGSAQQDLSEAIAQVLRRRDVSLAECEKLLAGMLANREQWLLLLPEIVQSTPAWDTLRAELEAPFRREHEDVLPQLQQRLAPYLPELLALARVGAANGAQHFDILAGIAAAEELIEAAHWQPFCKLLLTQDNWRRAINKRDGFPAATHALERGRVLALLSTFQEDDALLRLLCRAHSLPPASYSEEEWRVVRSIFVLLRRAIAELRVVFAEQGVIDFAEASIAANVALGDPGVQMRRDDRYQHILVDEFQDTSRPQLALLRRLLQDWQQQDGRTCFFVGDPMQSIYLFRAAEASLFQRIRRQGLQLEGSHIAVTPLTLRTNFRSTAAIVEPLNEVFAEVLVEDDMDSVGYAAAVSGRPSTGAAPDAMHVHVLVAHEDQKASSPALQEEQADAVVRQISAQLPSIEQARREGTKHRVAVLVRTRAHLPAILARLRQHGIPFRGVKIEPLADRPEIQDLLSLLRALLHPADRIAWLSVLRAPWCGLPLTALHAICGDGDEQSRRATIPDLLHQNMSRLSPDNGQRALHVVRVLEHAAAAYANGGLSTSPSALSLWLERTWQALGAPFFLDAQAKANTEVFFNALSRMPASSLGPLDESFNRALEELYAEPDPATSDDYGVQVMTIHGAKGLEFEVVLVPALERNGRADDHQLFRSLIRRRLDDSGDELLLAPIGRKQDGQPPAMYRWVGRKWSQRLRQEHKRLLYVACSRAICELHLFAIVERDSAGKVCKPGSGSLLAAGWEGLLLRIEAAVTHADLQAAAAAAEHTTAAPIAELATDGTADRDEPPQLNLFATSGILHDLAASAPRQSPRRMPQSWFSAAPAISAVKNIADATSVAVLRSPGDHLARVRGTVLHALFAHVATLRGLKSAEDPRWDALAKALLRQHSLGATDETKLHHSILAALRNALTHPEGIWLLNAAPSALNEKSWTSISHGRLQRYRPDRIFRGGATPMSAGEEYLWIVDYKTAALPEASDRANFLAQSREQYRDQLETYSRVLRASDSSAARQPHRLAIYHPALPHLDWWSADAD